MNDWIQKYNQSERPNSEQSATTDEFDLFMELSEPEFSIDTENAWLKVQSKVSNHKSKSFFTIWRIAAILVLGLGLAFAAYQFTSFDQPNQMVLIENVSHHILPDGSTVELANNANISYNSENFLINRQLQLVGEAYFEVVRDESLFKIQTEKGEVTVLGTSFNLNTTSGFDLYVTSGTVEISTDKYKQQITKGFRATTNANGAISVSKMENQNLLGWRTGYFSFENQPLEDIIPYLEKYYDVKINSSKSLQKCKITAEFDQLSLREVVKIISTVLNAKVDIQSNKVRFSGKGCN